MTPEQVKIVRLTFAQAMNRKIEVGMVFYERLFAIAPDTRILFKGDIEEQSRKLMDTLAIAIGNLRDTPALVSMLEALAHRHVAYGVREEHYDKVGEALLWTLEKVFGAAFTAEVRDAWATLYGIVAETMLKATAGTTQARAGRSASA
ncbi:MAG TPA: globin family protein [Xanthobacteraceae bacterium]|nr:globin family protein [Xanthobacteraceae bacterium]